MANCYYCGDDDHTGKNCPQLVAKQREVAAQQRVTAPSRPRGGAPETWCSYCDENTRLIEMETTAARCPRCHPLRFQQLKQNRKCPSCNATVYVWDHSLDCEAHAGPGRALPRPAVSGRPESTRVEPRVLCRRSPLGGMVHAAGCTCPPGSP